MKTIRISPTLEIPLLDFATQASAALGIKGSGKSQDMGFMAEQLMSEGIPITVLDPAGVWRFLKVPGRGAGFPVVVIGGEDADFPLSEHTIEDITRAAMKEGVSIVVDLFTSRPSKNLIRQIVLKCVSTMFYDNKKYGVRTVFLEEAAEVVPQRIQKDMTSVYSAVEQLVRVGGNCSLGVVMINPRAENLNKDVLELCDFVFLHRQRGRRSLKNLDDWFEQAGLDDKQVDSIIADTMTMGAGECYFMSKDSSHPVRLKFPLKRSFHPDRKNPQAEIVAVKKTVDVAEWVTKLKAALPKPEEKKAAPMTMKHVVATPPQPLVKEVEKVVEVPILTDKDRELLRSVVQEVHGIKEQIGTFESHLSEISMRVETQLQRLRILGTRRPSSIQTSVSRHPVAELKPIPSAEESPVLRMSSDDERAKLLSGKSGVRRMLVALAQRSPLTRKQLGLRAQVSPKGGSFDTYISKAVMNGWIARDGYDYLITQEGLADLGPYDPLPTGPELLNHYLDELGESGPARMLRALADAYPRSLSRTELGEAAQVSPSGGSFDTYVSKLVTLELITKTNGYRASEELFSSE
jgi:uncharacterized protein